MGEDKEKVISAVEEEKAQESVEETAVQEETKEEKTEKKEKSKKKKKQTADELVLEIQDELSELKDKYLRSLAETENYKKRINEDLKRERKYAGYSLANKLIDSIEIFNQALNIKTEDPAVKNFLYGFKMIDDMIFNAMKEEGVALIDTKVGDPFDPNKQHAMDKEYDPDQPENTVLKVVKKGYLFKDRILRPSMVVINIKPEEETPEEQPETEEVDE